MSLCCCARQRACRERPPRWCDALIVCPRPQDLLDGSKREIDALFEKRRAMEMHFMEDKQVRVCVCVRASRCLRRVCLHGILCTHARPHVRVRVMTLRCAEP